MTAWAHAKTGEKQPELIQFDTKSNFKGTKTIDTSMSAEDQKRALI
jgi:hypothetical protein